MAQKKELEIIQHTKMNSLELFLIEVTSRNPHGHDDLELGVIMEGSITIFLEQESFLLHKGDIFLINRHQVHSLYRTNEKNLILEDLARTKQALDNAYDHFENVVDPDLIDCYIYEVNAVQQKYKYLLKMAKQLQITPKIPEF